MPRTTLTSAQRQRALRDQIEAAALRLRHALLSPRVVFGPAEAKRIRFLARTLTVTQLKTLEELSLTRRARELSATAFPDTTRGLVEVGHATHE